MTCVNKSLSVYTWHLHALLGIVHKVTCGLKKEIHSFMSDPLPQMKEVESLTPQICMHPPDLCALFIMYIHNVHFQILSWAIILPQKLTSNTFYLFPHGCGITL